MTLVSYLSSPEIIFLYPFTVLEPDLKTNYCNDLCTEGL